MNKTLDRNIGVLGGGRAFAFIVSSMIIAEPAFAAAGGEGHHATFVDIIPYWVNFLIYVSVIYFIFRGSAAEAWRRRRANIESSISAIQREMQALETRIAEARGKLASIDKEIARIDTEIGREAEGESSLIAAEAERAAKRIREQGQDLIKAERRNVEAAVQKELAENVIRLATEKLKAESSLQADKARRDASLGYIGQLVQ